MGSSKKFTDEHLQGEELEIYTEKFLSAKFDRDRKKRWEKILAEKHGVKPPMRKTAKRKTLTLYLWMGAIAATILLLFLFKPAFLQFSNNSYQQLADNYLQEDFFPNQEISKGDENINQLKLAAALAYNRKDFSSAITHYEQLITLGAGEDQHLFFLGLSYLYGQDYPKAIEQLSLFVGNSSNGTFLQETQWFLALSYLKNEQPDIAKPLLEAVKKGTWNAEKAALLLKKLE